MASDQQKAYERYEELQNLYIQFGYFLQMLRNDIERGEIETDRARSISDNLDLMRDKVQSIEYYLEE